MPNVAEDEIDIGLWALIAAREFDSSLDISVYLDRLDKKAAEIKKMLAGRNSDMEKFLATRMFIYENGPWNNFQPYAYDLDDPLGNNPKNRFLSTFMDTRLGNCINMPFIFAGCTRQHIYICTPDESQCITIIDRAFSNVRYIIDGKQTSVPDTNYVKIRISNEYPPGDAINICWKHNEYQWEAIVDKSTIIIDKLNPRFFLFGTELDTNSNGIPTESSFRKEGCATLSLYDEINVVPEGNVVYSYK